MDNKTVSLLLVEDDEIDVEAIKRALRDLKIANPLFVARDGIEALEFLRGENGREKIEPPYVILLDINMPRMNGFEFLLEIRADEKLHSSVIFVLTTSKSDEDMMQAYGNHVAGYIVKSNAASGFFDTITMLGSYWRVVELPKG